MPCAWGAGLRSKPVIVTTIYRTIVFSVFVGMFNVVEHIVGALLHHKNVSEGIEEITSKGWRKLVAWCVLIVAAFLPFFGFKEIGRVMGEINSTRCSSGGTWMKLVLQLRVKAMRQNIWLRKL
jgi:hypothetical protein